MEQLTEAQVQVSEQRSIDNELTEVWIQGQRCTDGGIGSRITGWSLDHHDTDSGKVKKTQVQSKIIGLDGRSTNRGPGLRVD